MNNKLGLIFTDDQDFGNEYFTSLIFSDGRDSLDYQGQRPNHFYGVSAIVEHEGEFHLMSEDDGYFKTKAILNKQECLDLRDVISKVSDTVVLKPNWKYSLTRHHRDFWEHSKFPATVIVRKDARPVLEIVVKDTNLGFDISWANDFIKTLTF